MKSEIFSQKSIATFVNVANELKVPVNKGTTLEKLFEQLSEKFKSIDNKDLNNVQRAVKNTINSYFYANSRQYRIQAYTAKKPGICEAIKVAGINATKTNPVNVNNLAETLAKKFNKDTKKMLQRVLSQYTYYLLKEHNVVMKSDDNKQTFYCVNRDYAVKRLSK